MYVQEALVLCGAVHMLMSHLPSGDDQFACMID